MGVRKDGRWFICQRCNEKLYLKRCVGGHWVLYLQPNFCPTCGAEVDKPKEVDGACSS